MMKTLLWFLFTGIFGFSFITGCDKEKEKAGNRELTVSGKGTSASDEYIQITVAKLNGKVQHNAIFEIKSDR